MAAWSLEAPTSPGPMDRGLGDGGRRHTRRSRGLLGQEGEEGRSRQREQKAQREAQEPGRVAGRVACEGGSERLGPAGRGGPESGGTGGPVRLRWGHKLCWQKGGDPRRRWGVEEESFSPLLPCPEAQGRGGAARRGDVDAASKLVAMETRQQHPAPLGRWASQPTSARTGMTQGRGASGGGRASPPSRAQSAQVRNEHRTGPPAKPSRQT